MSKLGLLCLAMLAACATGNSVQKPPAIELPAAWKESAPRFAEDGRLVFATRYLAPQRS